MPVDPTFMLGPGVTGAEWQIGGAEAGPPAAAPGAGFGDMLAAQLSELQATQTKAADASRALAEGTAGDVSSVVMDIERARLSMQLAAQIRTKAVESLQDIFHTPV